MPSKSPEVRRIRLLIDLCLIRFPSLSLFGPAIDLRLACYKVCLTLWVEYFAGELVHIEFFAGLQVSDELVLIV